MKLELVVGNDIGNSEQSIYIDGKLIRQPNVYAGAVSIPWTDDDTDVPKNLKNIYDNLVVSIISSAVPTGTYLIGRHALKTVGENVTSLYVKGNNAKSDQMIPYINTLGTIAARAVEVAYERGSLPDSITVNSDQAIAMPVKQHTPRNVETLQSKFMSGSHNVTVHLGLTKKVDVKIEFDYVQVLQEGTPPVFALQMDRESNWRTGSYEKPQLAAKAKDKGKNVDLFEEFAIEYKLGDIDGSYLDGKNILHVDLGDGTTDFPFTRGDAVDKDFCHGVNHGVGHAIVEAVDDLLVLAPYAFNSISRQQYSDILISEFSDRKHKFLQEAKQAFRPHLDNQVNQIMQHISDQVLKIGANEIDIIAVYGGGSILMRESIHPRIKLLADNSRIQLFYIPAKYAVTLNAEGLDWFVRSSLYSKLKKVYKETHKRIAAAGE
ncbi:ParM/StbA family protein [Paenibacillus alkaliterrae]|uniref:ParM/StbA family protein n=1 Tax=Paenibacillus alkaliterrae TaxID=320909 RepID=UPI001F3E6710|nr:ParM/StbA family protein [Paenibacillus alkaliterrae]MCF2940552.1 ParM/StbA family protein [Paenibacillus alkaliterrae]